MPDGIIEIDLSSDVEEFLARELHHRLYYAECAIVKAIKYAEEHPEDAAGVAKLLMAGVAEGRREELADNMGDSPWWPPAEDDAGVSDDE